MGDQEGVHRRRDLGFPGWDSLLRSETGAEVVEGAAHVASACGVWEGSLGRGVPGRGGDAPAALPERRCVPSPPQSVAVGAEYL